MPTFANPFIICVILNIAYSQAHQLSRNGKKISLVHVRGLQVSTYLFSIRLILFHFRCWTIFYQHLGDKFHLVNQLAFALDLTWESCTSVFVFCQNDMHQHNCWMNTCLISNLVCLPSSAQSTHYTPDIITHRYF